jgi:hypothetical protein
MIALVATVQKMLDYIPRLSWKVAQQNLKFSEYTLSHEKRMYVFIQKAI